MTHFHKKQQKNGVSLKRKMKRNQPRQKNRKSQKIRMQNSKVNPRLARNEAKIQRAKKTRLIKKQMECMTSRLKMMLLSQPSSNPRNQKLATNVNFKKRINLG